MSPITMFSDGVSYVISIRSTGSLDNDGTGATFGIAPVINLGFEYISTLIGTGIMTDPYRAPNVTP